jgi:hypothetical protein
MKWLGLLRVAQDHLAGLKKCGMFLAKNDGGVYQHTIGAAGEAMFSPFSGIPFNPDYRGKWDVGQWQVRTRPLSNDELFVRRDDLVKKREHAFALVTKTTTKDLYMMHGWVYGKEAQKLGKYSRGGPWKSAWLVPPRLVHPFFVTHKWLVKLWSLLPVGSFVKFGGHTIKTASAPFIEGGIGRIYLEGFDESCPLEGVTWRWSKWA